MSKHEKPHHRLARAAQTDSLQSLLPLIAHDLRGPIGRNLAFLSLIEKKLPSDEDKATFYLQRARNAAEEGMQILDDLVDFARLADQKPKVQAASLADVIQFTIAKLASKLDDSQGSIRLSTLPEIHCDPHHMALLFRNLFSVIHDYHREGEPPQLSIRARRYGDGHLVGVLDTGLTLDGKEQDELFRPGFRLANDTRFAGSGLELAICARIVELHGGRIWIRTRGQQGASIFFTLPNQAADELPAIAAA